MFHSLRSIERYSLFYYTPPPPPKCQVLKEVKKYFLYIDIIFEKNYNISVKK